MRSLFQQIKTIRLILLQRERARQNSLSLFKRSTPSNEARFRPDPMPSMSC